MQPTQNPEVNKSMTQHNATCGRLPIRVFLVLLALALCATSARAQSSGADVYQSKCKMCHGADLKGNTPGGKMTHAQPLDTPEVIKKTDADLIATTKKGKNKMPEFATKLSDAQINSVIAYIRTLQKK